ncbi:hypothetical protein ACLB2K_062302 [Fragaria x ananassa]
MSQSSEGPSALKRKRQDSQLDSLTEHECRIYDAIRSTKDMGINKQAIKRETNLTAVLINKSLKTFEGPSTIWVSPLPSAFAHFKTTYMKSRSSGFGGDGYSEVKHVDARAIPGWVTYWEAAPELPETKSGFEGDGYSEVKHVDARAIPGWVTYWEAAPELPETKP